MSTEAAVERPPRKRRPGNADDAVYRGVYDAVLDGRLPPGVRLPEKSLGDAFGVSRIVVRKALSRLAHEHIVTRRPNQMARVASPSVRETRDIFEARRLLEAEVVRELAGSLTKAQARQIADLLQREQAAQRMHHIEERVRLSIEFHRQLAECSANSVYRRYLKELVSRSSLTVALYKAPGASPCYMEGEHEGIAEAILTGRGEEAAALAVAHLDALENTLDLSPREPDVDLSSVFR